MGIGALRDNSAHRKIWEYLLGSSGVVSYHSISNQCTLVLANQQAGIYVPANELEIIRFWPFSLWGARVAPQNTSERWYYSCLYYCL